jgi:predicted dehydrogenase
VSVRVALIGCGAWGENLLRTLAARERARVVAVADPDPARLGRARAIAPGARGVPSLDEALAAGVDAVVIATPPASHADLALRALEAGADVLVEKPLALGVADAERCAARAAALGRIGMVGHLLRFHPAVARLLDLARDGRLGRLTGMSATRRSTRVGGGFGGAAGLVPAEPPSVDRDAGGAWPALWALGPHDLSVLRALDGAPLREIDAEAAPAAPGEERLLVSARLLSGIGAHLELGRSCLAKERRLRLTGTARIALLDDVRAPDRILLAARRARALAGEPPEIVEEIRVPWREPLAIELEHFLRCVEERSRPLTPLEEGAAIVRALARAEAALALSARTGRREIVKGILLPDRGEFNARARRREDAKKQRIYI